MHANEYYLQLVVNDIKRESSRRGRKFNVDKTEIQLISKRKDDTKIFIQRNKLKQVKEFFNLGGQFVDEGATESDVQIRIG